MSEPSFEQLGGVLAAPPRRPWRLMIATAVVALAMALIAVIAVIGMAKPAVRHARNLIATIKDPRGGKGASAGAFSPDGKTLAISDNNGRTYLWDLAARRWAGELPHGPCQGGAAQVLFSPDGKTLAVIGGKFSDDSPDGISCLWDLASGREVATFVVPLRPIIPNGLSASGAAAGGAFSPDGRTLAIADSNGDTYLWDVATGRKVAVLTDPHVTDPDSTTFVDSVAFSPDGKTLAVGDDRQTNIWDLATHRVAAILTDPSGGSELDGSGTANALAFSPDGTTLAVGDGNGNIYLWDVASRRVIAHLAQPVAPLECNGAYNQQGEDSYGLVVPGGGPLGASVAFSPDGRFLATDVQCGRGVYLWNVARHTRPVTLAGSGFDAFASPVVFSPDGAMVANFDGTTRVWRV
jgi:WD40 repeat protein